ncbi:MAG: CHAD domain-containing protein [Chitinophagaceae bacterium]|nr:CHAD domain-containing protein [Chitinophagaceae bacterium]MBP6233865.1 CHAD domain-containing protein [Chitinophagaceae bacterium]MBP6416725.1 CHAD domain-containing protein [Chitinophagaceae bacterium]
MSDYNILFLQWKKIQKDFEKNLSLLLLRINTEPVHDIRVATKKLRALLSLYSLLKNEPEDEYFFQQTESLFDILGRNRDAETCLALTIAFEKESNSSCKEWKNYLRSQIKTTRAWANQEIHRYHKKELVKVSLLFKQDSCLADSNKFHDDLTAIIYTHLSETKKHFRQPHLVRKKLKEVYYWVALFPDDKLSNSWHPEELHSILDDLGSWQDNQILKERMKHFRKDYLPKPFKEYELLKDFEIKISATQSFLLKSANSKARRWIKKVTDKQKSET